MIYIRNNMPDVSCLTKAWGARYAPVQTNRGISFYGDSHEKYKFNSDGLIIVGSFDADSGNIHNKSR